MFLKRVSPERGDFSRSRMKKALPLFLLLEGCGVVIALLALLVLRVHLQSIEESTVRQQLAAVLSRLGPEQLLYASDSSFIGTGEGLLFLRLVQGGRQLLFQGGGRAPDFAVLAALDPEKSGVWLQLDGAPLLTVVSRRLPGGLLLQAGRSAEASRALYRSARRSAWLLLSAGALLLWPLSLLLVKLALAPVFTMRKRVAELADSGQTGYLPESGSDPEFVRLSAEINALLRANRRLVTGMQQSLDNVAHDLRTPLTRLRSVAEYGLRERAPEQLQEALSDCLEESEQMLAMLKVMMSVAEAESGTMRLERRVVALNQSLERAVTLYEYVAEERKVTIELELDRDLHARVDETRIAQVWANLLDNAIKYGHSGGRVRIDGRMVQGEARVRFVDDGIGISAGEQEHIWERLYRGDRSRTEKGLGLGLNYVRAVVAAHGGAISVTSALNCGSTFEVVLPGGDAE